MPTAPPLYCLPSSSHPHRAKTSWHPLQFADACYESWPGCYELLAHPPATKSVNNTHHDQTWATSLANHAADIWACDFVQTYDLFFASIFLFFIFEHSSRRVVHFAVTRSPSEVWLAQQIREATPFGQGPRFLICDHDAKYGTLFGHAVAGAAIELLRTPPHAPKANALCERFVGSVRRECLDFVLIVSETQARRVVHEYVTYFNRARPHQGIDQIIPVSAEVPPLASNANRKVIGLPILHGLHHDYRWAA